MECMAVASGAHCYEVLQNTLNFQDAISDCQSRGAHLVTISSQQEFEV